MNILQGKDGDDVVGGAGFGGMENFTGGIFGNLGLGVGCENRLGLGDDKQEVGEDFSNEIGGGLARVKGGREMGKSESEVGMAGSRWVESRSSKTGGLGSVSPFMPECAPSKTQQVFGARNAGTGYHKQNLSTAKADLSTEFPDRNLLTPGYSEKTPTRRAEYKSYFGSSQRTQAQAQPQTPTANTNYSTTQKCYDHKSPN